MVKTTANQRFVARQRRWDVCGFGAGRTLMWSLERQKVPLLYFYVSQFKASYLQSDFSGAD